jgi:hypothetical protein
VQKKRVAPHPIIYWKKEKTLPLYLSADIHKYENQD